MIKSWLEDCGLELVEYKTELTLFTKGRKQKISRFASVHRLFTLGVIFHSKLTFKPHLKLVGQETIDHHFNIGQDDAKISGLKHSRQLP